MCYNTELSKSGDVRSVTEKLGGSESVRVRALQVRAYPLWVRSDSFSDCGDSNFGNMGDVMGIICLGY